MGRKRPPGAKPKGPTARKSAGLSAAMHRIMNSWVIAFCGEDYFPEVASALQSFFSEGKFHPPLPENYSFGAMGFGDESGGVPITCYGLQSGHMDMAMSWLEHHDLAHKWQLWVPDEPERAFPG